MWLRLSTALAVVGIGLNLEAVQIFPVSGHRSGKRTVWRLTCVGKLQIRHAGEYESCCRRGVGQLNPLVGEAYTQDMYLAKWMNYTKSQKDKIRQKR